MQYGFKKLKAVETKTQRACTFIPYYHELHDLFSKYVFFFFLIVKGLKTKEYYHELHDFYSQSTFLFGKVSSNLILVIFHQRLYLYSVSFGLSYYFTNQDVKRRLYLDMDI